MELQHLTLTNFKNIPEASLDFCPGLNCFLGDNGMGKSNLLDAIYVLSFCKSFSGVTDSMLINSNADFAMARGVYLKHDLTEELTLGLARGRRKSLKRQGKEYQRLSEHIGSFPIVMVAPQDIDIIRGSGEERRRWMDMVISQSNPRYLDTLIRYNRVLEQRNKLLRDGVSDPNLYLAIEMQMGAAASYICSERAQWIDELRKLFGSYYKAIAGENAESTDIRYDSRLLDPEGTAVSLQILLDSARSRDEILHHTTVGPHRDDIELTLDGMPVRRTGSQGQCKTFTIAMRLAQYEFLRRSVGFKPLLLLDDIFDKLDARRVERIMALVSGRQFGQIFITDTNRRHLDETVALTGGNEHRLWSVENGHFSPINTTNP